MGYGNIGQALSPLLRRRFPELPISVFDERMEADQVAIAAAHGMPWQRVCLTADNYVEQLTPQVAAGVLVLNLATSIDSVVLASWSQSRGAFYLDTCIDPWSYQDGEIDSAANTNYRMRETMLALQRQQQAAGDLPPTAVVAHGANPGFVSILVKEALLLMAAEHLAEPTCPGSAAEWAALAETLGVRVIQISERDSQYSSRPRGEGEFVNTWSVDGFVAEALQPIEMGWGNHEAHGPWASQVRGHAVGDGSGVYAPQLGAHTRVKSWSPAAGEFTGFLISHNEAFSLASWLTLKSDDGLRYRPTVYYAYHPCDQAVESLVLLADGTRDAITSTRVLKDEIEGGIDELGVLLVSDRVPSLWLGSQLSIAAARAHAPYNNATSLQVVSSVMAALEWMLQHPRAGIIESESLDHELLMAHARATWEPLVHEFRAWHPQGEAASHDPSAWCLDRFLA